MQIAILIVSLICLAIFIIYNNKKTDFSTPYREFLVYGRYLGEGVYEIGDVPYNRYVDANTEKPQCDIKVKPFPTGTWISEKDIGVGEFLGKGKTSYPIYEFKFAGKLWYSILPYLKTETELRTITCKPCVVGVRAYPDMVKSDIARDDVLSTYFLKLKTLNTIEEVYEYRPKTRYRIAVEFVNKVPPIMENTTKFEDV